MVQSGEILGDLLVAIPQAMFPTGVEALKRRVKKRCNIEKKYSARIS